MGSLLLSFGSWWTQDFVCALQDWSLCFPQSCVSPIIKSHWFSRPNSQQIPSPFVRSQGWEAWSGLQNLHNSGRNSLVLWFSSLWATHLAGMGFDLIMIEPLLPSHCGFFFDFECGDIFFGGFQRPLVDGCSTATYSFAVLAVGDEHMSFYYSVLECISHVWIVSVFSVACIVLILVHTLI